MTTIKEYLKQHRLLSDGAFGTYYAQCFKGQEDAAEWANVENPALVKQIHKEYIQAGARLIRTNTFAANEAMLLCTRKEQKEILQKGYFLAKEAVEESGKEVFIAADIGPIPENLSAGHKEVLEEYVFIYDTLIECGAEIILFETFPDFIYIDALITYQREKQQKNVNNKNNLPFLMAQFCLNRYGYSRTGISATRLVEQAMQMEEIGAVGFNCGIGSGHMLEVYKKLNISEEKYFMAMPNSSYPQLLQDRAVYLDNSQYFAERIKDIADLGVDIIGGCCGTTPEYIKKAAAIVEDSPVIHIDNYKIKEKSNKTISVKENLFLQKIKKGKKVIAVELDPPYDEKFEKIMECANILKAEGVDMLTFADSPMAKPRMDSTLTSIKVRTEVDIPVMPHISCRDKNMIAMRAGLLGAYANGIRNLLLVTGDPIPGSDRTQVTSVFDFNSIRLMEFIKEMNKEHWQREPLCYGGALNHARANIEVEIERMRKKIAAGASYFLTQPIFSMEDIERIRYIKGKIDTKILCGIMPLVNYRNAVFIQNEITGIHVPDSVVKAFSPEMTREEGEKAGVKIAVQTMKELFDVVDGYYFMLPFNRVKLVSMCLGQIREE